MKYSESRVGNTKSAADIWNELIGTAVRLDSCLPCQRINTKLGRNVKHGGKKTIGTLLLYMVDFLLPFIVTTYHQLGQAVA